MAEGIGNIVAQHYNNLDEKGVEQRKESRIFIMRNFNNWLKSMLINEYLDKIKNSARDRGDHLRIHVLDMGCGKGGDLLKWQRGRVSHVTCADIAETSVQQAEGRYRDMKHRNRNQHLFSAEFIAADCTKENLKSKYRKSDIQFDIVSCQFAFHYCFESLPQAECMLQNASECLKPGGYFIGTTPDAYDIVNRVRSTGTNKVGNQIYSITFEDEKTLENPPLFGAQYSFHLEGVVDCPEFLVHFPTLIKLAEKYGLMLVGKRRFGSYFQSNKDNGRDLLGRMNALETYPPFPGSNLVSENPLTDYKGAEEFVHQNPDRDVRVGTMSKDEWEATTLYTTFAFKKLSL